MKEPQYKPITGMINVNDIQEIIDNNRYFQEEIERQKEIIRQLDIKNLELTTIIKEVREYIKENEFYLDYKTGACIKGVIPLLEILDKADKEK